MGKIAILLTCYNRKEKTILCLASLFDAITFSSYKTVYDIYLVDDGSTDGTSEEIKNLFSEIKVIKGTGNLFWAGGMRLAWETALKNDSNYDSYILLNDDVILNRNFINDLLNTHDYCLNHYNKSGIYVSSTQNKSLSRITYGGKLLIKKGIKFKLVNIIPSQVPISCSLANANILMVSKAVVKSIGIIDSRFKHGMADFDYTLTASRQGFPVLVSTEIGGFCENDHGKNWLSSDSRLKDRIKFLYSPKGLSYKDQIYYLSKNFKFQLPYYFILLWLKTIYPFLWDKFKNNNEKVNV